MSDRGHGGRGGLLGGRFAARPAAAMERFASSLAVDLEMLADDVAGSVAHATMLGEVGILTAAEVATLVDGLHAVEHEIVHGEWVPGDELEDVHMAVEARLTERVGEVGKKLHTARSRNDQVATDVRLWTKRHLDLLDAAAGDAVIALLDRVESDGRAVVPGYTHLQRGQPVLLGHHLLAHAWALERDRERFRDARRRVDLSPLGAGAMAGTPHPIDRERTAELLGFAGVVPNAMDAVAARDHLQEVAAACAICMIGLSRQAEELVLWSSQEMRLVRLADDYTTGSSIMPQKRNPDAAELVRGKSGRVVGDLQALLVMVKGLPLAYNRDLQEDREALFDAVRTTLDCLAITAGMWRTLTIDRDRFEAELHGDFALATELADELVRRGVAFREAHEVVGRLVRACEEKGGDLTAADPALLADLHPALPTDLTPWLDPRAAAERRTSLGGTAWSEVERQVATLRRRIDG